MTREISHLQFISLYNKGMSDGKIGKALGFTKWKIRGYRRKMKLAANFAPRRSFSAEDKATIGTLHTQDLTVSEIARRINRSYPAVLRLCTAMGLDTSMGRGQRLKIVGGETTEQRRTRRVESLLSYLKEHGPTPQNVLVQKLRFGSAVLPRFSRELFDYIERLQFTVKATPRGGTKYGGSVIYGSLNKLGPVFALRGDHRIVDFVAERIPFKVESSNNAQTLVMHLKKQIGYERAREVVEKLGYKYIRPSHKAPKLTMKEAAERRKKFSDDEFFNLYSQGLNDREIAKKFNVCSKTIGNRRRSMSLPTVGRRKKLIHCPKCGHKF